MADVDSNGVTHKYIYGKGLLAVETSSARYCYHFDGTGNTVAITDMTQAIVNSYAYEPFGQILSQQETVTQPFKYVGQYGVMAEPNGLYYMRARYYDPTVGRFISEDPLGFGGGDVNLFAYVSNNPIGAIDPYGLEHTCTDCQITYSAVGPLPQAPDGALGFHPPNDSVAISPAEFGLPFGTIAERSTTQKDIINNIPNIRISAPGLSEYLTGGTTFTIGDIGDINIRNSPFTRFDIYRFETKQDALDFGMKTVPTTITGLPDSWACPASCKDSAKCE
jgi:RHS repeat-associated protein